MQLNISQILGETIMLVFSCINKEDQDVWWKNAIEFSKKYNFDYKSEAAIIKFAIDFNIITNKQYTDDMSQNVGYPNRDAYLIENGVWFGSVYALGLLAFSIPNLLIPTKKFDPLYEGQYDMIYYIPECKSIPLIESKAARAARATGEHEFDPLVTRAIWLSSGEKWKLLFQHTKDGLCHVFVLVGVFADCHRFWVMNSHDVYLERDLKIRNCGDDDLQITINHSNEHKFSKFETDLDGIGKAINDQYNLLEDMYLKDPYQPDVLNPKDRGKGIKFPPVRDYNTGNNLFDLTGEGVASMVEETSKRIGDAKNLCPTVMDFIRDMRLAGRIPKFVKPFCCDRTYVKKGFEWEIIVPKD